MIRYEDGDLIPFPARELDAYRNYYISMQNFAPPPERAQQQGNVLFAGFNPGPNTYADIVAQTGGLVLSLCPFFPQGSNEQETLRQFVHFLPQLLHAEGLRHQDVESSCAMIHARSAKEKAQYAHKSAIPMSPRLSR